MRILVCRDCGKRYDYDKDDFCPKCGSYNPPQDDPSTPLERELLARFAPARESQATAKNQQQMRHTAARPRTAPPHGGAHPRQRPSPRGVSATTAAAPEPRKHSLCAGDHAVCGPEASPRRRIRRHVHPAVKMLVVIILVVAVLAILNLVLHSFITGVTGGSSGLADPEGPALIEHEMMEPFQINGAGISIDDAWWVDLTGDSQVERPGYDCLAVDVWIISGTQQRGLYIDNPELETASGGIYALEDDMFLAQRLAGYGIYAVTLSDYQWEDLLYGQFIFFLPEGTAGDATLIIEEYALGDVDSPAPTAIHRVRIPLP